MTDQPIDVAHELEEASIRLPVVLPDNPMPLEMSIRSLALTIAQRHVGDTVIKEGNLYQQVKMDNKLGNPVSVEDVLKTALVFERYLWGEWSKGIAEHALEATLTSAADAIEEEFKKGPPVRPHGGADND